MSNLCVAATADDRVTIIRRIEYDADAIDVSLVLKANPGTLSGTVAGRPVPGVRVFLPSGFKEPMPGIQTAITDNAGRYVIAGLNRWQAGGVTQVVVGGKWEQITATRCHFLFDHPDFARTTAAYESVPQTVNVTLHPPAVIEGAVVDAVTDQPAASVVVSAQGVARYGWYQTRTDAHGRFRLIMTKDHYNIWAEAEDRIAVAAKAIAAEPGKTNSIPDIRLLRGGFVTGRVIDSATNRPPATPADRDLRVAHYGPARPRTGAAVTSTQVNADGTYRLRVAPGNNYVYLMNGKASQVVSIEDGQEVHVDLRTGEHHGAAADLAADLQLGAKLCQQAEAEDAPGDVDAEAPIDALPKPLPRKRGDTPADRLLGKLEAQNAGGELFKDAWLRTLKEIIELGPVAVPDLAAELDATQDDRMLRCLGFIMRAIGDKRAVPALIRAIPKTLRPAGSDMGLRAEDAALFKFAQQNDLDPSDRAGHYSFGRPVREICGALEKLTEQEFGEQQLYHVFLDGLPSQRQMKRELFKRTAKAWADWWEKNGANQIGDPTYVRVGLPELRVEESKTPPPPGMHFKTVSGGSGWILESVLNPDSKIVFYDFDTGRAAALPERWRKTEKIEARLDEITAWALGEGFDLMGAEYVMPGDGRRYFALRSLGMRAWELGRKRWKMQADNITLEELQAQGTPASGLVLHHNEQTDSFDPKAITTFLFITREGTPGILFVGVEVQDDSLQPGQPASGDSELKPIAFKKGRRFGFSNFEEARPAARNRR